MAPRLVNQLSKQVTSLWFSALQMKSIRKTKRIAKNVIILSDSVVMQDVSLEKKRVPKMGHVFNLHLIIVNVAVTWN